MIVKTCKKHGPLTIEQTSIHRRLSGKNKGRSDIVCRICVNDRANKKYHDNKSIISEKRKLEYRENPEPAKLRHKRRYKLKSQEIIEHVQNWTLQLKFEVLSHYSNGIPQCKNCGETNLKFLGLDHIHENGAEHRKQIGQASHMCAWAKRNGYPTDIFQVLCHNCNMIKHLEHHKPVKCPRSTRYLAKLKNTILSHYSNGIPQCVECGITDIRILTIDHMNGGGNKHRKSLPMKSKSSTNLYRWLRNEGFPPGFQVLCFNHNLGKHCLG